MLGRIERFVRDVQLGGDELGRGTCLGLRVRRARIDEILGGAWLPHASSANAGTMIHSLAVIGRPSC